MLGSTPISSRIHGHLDARRPEVDAKVEPREIRDDAFLEANLGATDHVSSCTPVPPSVLETPKAPR